MPCIHYHGWNDHTGFEDWCYLPPDNIDYLAEVNADWITFDKTDEWQILCYIYFTNENIWKLLDIYKDGPVVKLKLFKPCFGLYVWIGNKKSTKKTRLQRWEWEPLHSESYHDQRGWQGWLSLKVNHQSGVSEIRKNNKNDCHLLSPSFLPELCSVHVNVLYHLTLTSNPTKRCWYSYSLWMQILGLREAQSYDNTNMRWNKDLRGSLPNSTAHYFSTTQFWFICGLA